LDLAQIEAGKVTIHAVTAKVTEIESVLQDVLSMLLLLAEQKGLTLHFNTTADLSLNVLVDFKFLKQIFINLLSNAIKFTQEGSIDITLECCSDKLCIQVKDSGIGLTEKELISLFNEFTQVHTLAEKTQKGSGLGLAISKKLAHLFEAEIFLKSDGRGKGTEATLALKILKS